MNPTNCEFWQITKEDSTVWVKINRPAKKNAFNTQVVEELGQIIQEIANDPTIKVMVLSTTQNDMFCAGADIEWFYTLSEAQGRQVSIRAQEIFGQIELLPIPVIAAIKGLNLTAGFELTLCCDLIIAADNAQFGLVETKYGLTPGGGGTQRLTRIVGPLKAREMIYMAKIIPAQEALQIGLINEIVPLAQLDQRVKDIAVILNKNSSRAIKEAKKLIEEATYSNLHGFHLENKVFGEDFGSGEPKERFGKYLNKK